MRLLVVTPTRLLGEGLAACFRLHASISLPTTVRDLKQLREALKAAVADVVLIDVTQGIDLDEVRAIASEQTATACAGDAPGPRGALDRLTVSWHQKIEAEP